MHNFGRFQLENRLRSTCAHVWGLKNGNFYSKLELTHNSSKSLEITLISFHRMPSFAYSMQGSLYSYRNMNEEFLSEIAIKPLSDSRKNNEKLAVPQSSWISKNQDSRIRLQFYFISNYFALNQHPQSPINRRHGNISTCSNIIIRNLFDVTKTIPDCWKEKKNCGWKKFTHPTAIANRIK